MKKLTKTLCLASFMLFALTFSSSAVEKDTPAKNNAETSNQRFSSSENSKNTTATKKLTFREKFKMIKQIRKEMKKNPKGGSDVPMVVLIILAILIPPLAVGLFTNWKIETLWALLLWFCFWIPGVIYAFYILFR